MNIMNDRTKTRIILFLLVVIYLIFPTSIFFGEHNKLFESSASDKSFKVVVYKSGVYNFYSLYKFMSNEEYFFVVYDKCGNVVFKPHFWFGVSQSVVYGGFHFSKHNKNELFFPTNNGVDSIILESSKGCSL